ncbi:MAG TPA: phosphoenolpyruvate--protein phosphotransferase [Pseudogracilibacillus sp.]|nr:phosphoenolpyruvate--protein phosphotransferase [Pseudogracilibacillus sp.]
MSEQLKGISASNGYAIGRAYELVEPDLSFETLTINKPEAEVKRFDQALEKAKNELQLIRDKVAKEQDEENAKIFDAHLLVLEDPELVGAIENQINNKSINAEAALVENTDSFITIFEQMDNEYMRERAADIKDVRKRILSHLLEKPLPDISLVQEPTIIVAEDLTPSDTAQINKEFIKGFITDVGGRTSHSAIMARSLEIPAIVGVQTAVATIEHGEEVLIDGIEGDIFVQPSEDTKQKYKYLQKEYDKKLAEWALLKNEPSITVDEHQVELGANIGSYQDMDLVLKHGAEAIGLYRTEFLYMENNDFPTEEEQFEAYKSVLEAMENKPVVIRTLDIGGDKKLDYWDLPDEMNPFLGLRAVRLALQNKDVFRTQLRALLRASVYGNLKIMFPMIATLEEFREAEGLLLEEKENLLNEGVEVATDIEVGIMVEIPSTAILAEQFAKEVDFFSIGTNDLIQYTFAADRMNQNVSYLYQPLHPAILNLVKMVIDASHKEGKWTGMCGEMAGEPTAVPLLLGLGLDEFSMSPSSILPARSQVRNLKKIEMEKVANQALQLQSSEDVKRLVDTISENK